MTLNIIKNTAKGIGLGMFMAFGIMAFSSTETSAQNRDQRTQEDRQDDRDYRNNDRDRRNDDNDRRNDDRYDRNRNDVYRVARQNGFHDGQDVARSFRNDRDRNYPERTREYKRATNGYYSSLGNKNAYKDAYRQAFLEGYKTALYQNNRRNNDRRSY